MGLVHNHDHKELNCVVLEFKLQIYMRSTSSNFNTCKVLHHLSHQLKDYIFIIRGYGFSIFSMKSTLMGLALICERSNVRKTIIIFLFFLLNLLFISHHFFVDNPITWASRGTSYFSIIAPTL